MKSGPNGVRTHGRPVMSRALYLAKLWAQSAAGRTRTCDQSVNSRTLYLLSYGGNAVRIQQKRCFCGVKIVDFDSLQTQS